ncbi:hypothetical protein Psi02_69720 [Planotetraspora silvatica]|uniref:Lipoprotein n=1 Tax=Planotetraspora silvatica TaxID=234614 RepID=A0A8J3UR44_9ACTN|nr:hypothetical protein [Planotetraspora silvatica]GII50548.1 hypothetical protein Psi02_69720 [Planotetraspora silvatica]
MRRVPVLLAALGVLAAVSACQSSGEQAEAACAGADRAGSVHILQGGTNPLVGGARAGINSVGDDYEATLSLMGGAAGEPGTVSVKVGDQFTVAGHRFEVVEVCQSRVSVVDDS